MQPHFRHLVSPLILYTSRGIIGVARPVDLSTLFTEVLHSLRQPSILAWVSDVSPYDPFRPHSLTVLCFERMQRFRPVLFQHFEAQTHNRESRLGMYRTRPQISAYVRQKTTMQISSCSMPLALPPRSCSSHRIPFNGFSIAHTNVPFRRAIPQT